MVEYTPKGQDRQTHAFTEKEMHINVLNSNLGGKRIEST